ncbi:hypothetical protein I862_03200 [endosymbiont of Acanthamoeba sp. UWC8]|uniref:hypothetical protein n=1 Tax=endosymbiont of Acanthamoeba sp. UWC8 TaxID=86106 RepID=UPI0004D1A28B|nr:hypothetical protein [endosymbiont of Acanthamoeba sp. UWC8]AIF81201.1 hypothetical protein I862_03200 [endosymbiont of Acanthamoeba sp. UWC8]
MDELDQITGIRPIRPIDPIGYENLITSFPQSLIRQKPKTQINGLVVRVDKQHITIKTALGEVILKSKLNYETGTELTIEPYIQGEDVRLKIYALNSGNKAAFATFNLARRRGHKSYTKSTHVEQAFAIDKTSEFIHAILVNKRNSNLITNNPNILESISGHLPKNTSNLEGIFYEGNKFQFKLLQITEYSESVIYLSEENKVILSATINANDKFSEAILETIIGNFTFSNSELEFKNEDFIYLELSAILPLEVGTLKLDDLNEMLGFLDSLEHKSVQSFSYSADYLNLLKLKLDTRDDLLAVNLAQILLTNFSKTDLHIAENELEGKIQVVTHHIYELSLKMPWQVIIAPIIHNEILYFIKIFIKKPIEEPKELVRRFVIELDTVQLGKIVLDGLFTENKNITLLFLKLKSKTIFSSDFEEEIRNLFSMISKSQGYEGTISFSSMEEYTSPLAENLRSQRPL